jgi:sec-independent protein translocase protein TatB
MLPGLSFEHIIILGVIALVVVGPKDLPLLLRKMGQWTARLRGMAQEFRTGFDELARQAELDELKKEVDALRRTTSLNSVTNQFSKPLGTLESYAGISPPPPPPAVETPPAESAEPDRGPSGPQVAPEQSASEDARSEAPVRQAAP